ncbi:MAG: sugar phosphate isomerase/epimerase, partial [Deltaproteobacteria bacterium]|nr:sugar phosphate isomerase/epimerase [Deltaproteobacteria bacterium]
MAKFLLSAFADEASGSIDGQIRALKRNGIKFMEARIVEGKSIIDRDAASIKNMKKMLDHSGIAVSSIGSPIGKISAGDPFGPHIESFKRTLETARILGSKNIRIFSFYIPPDKSAAD